MKRGLVIGIALALLVVAYWMRPTVSSNVVLHVPYSYGGEHRFFYAPYYFPNATTMYAPLGSPYFYKVRLPFYSPTEYFRSYYPVYRARTAPGDYPFREVAYDYVVPDTVPKVGYQEYAGSLPATAQCSDTDGGDVPDVPGYVTVRGDQMVLARSIDTCMVNTNIVHEGPMLREFYCDGNEVKSRDVKCKCTWTKQGGFCE